MVTKTPNIRHRHASRKNIRHSKQYFTWIAEQNARLALAAVAATGVLTASANAGDGKIVTIGAKVYTFQTTLTNADGNIHIGADLTASLLNLARAINASGGTAGTDYAAANTINADVSATSDATHLNLTAKVVGAAPNAKVTTTNIVSASFGAATLTGGVTQVIPNVAAKLLTNSAERIAGAANYGALA